MDFTQFIVTLERFGLTDALLPFLLIFAIVFASLQKVKVFGQDKKNISIIIALVMGLLVVIPHVTDSYPPGRDIVEIMNNAIPSISLIIVAIVMLLILLGVFGSELDIAGTSLAGWIAILAFLTVLYVFGASAKWWQSGWLSWLGGWDTWAIVIILLIFGIVIHIITAEPGKVVQGHAANKVQEYIGKLFR